MLNRILRWLAGGLPPPAPRYKGRLASIEFDPLLPQPQPPVKWTKEHGQVGDCALYADGQGWLNVYETVNGRVHAGGVYRTPAAADRVCKEHRRQRVFVRWEV